MSSHAGLSPFPVPLRLCSSRCHGPAREASRHLRLIHQARTSHPHGLYAGGQALHQLYRCPKQSGRLPHLAGQPEEGGQVDGHLLPPHHLSLRSHQLCLGAEFFGPCRALSRSGERTVGDMQGHYAPNQGGGDASGAQPAPWRAQPPGQPGQLPPAQGGRPSQHPQPHLHHPSPNTQLIMMPKTTYTLYISLSAINIYSQNQ